MLSLLLPFLVVASVPGGGIVETTRPAASVIRTACQVVTRADVEQALGRTVEPGKEELGRSLSTCDYRNSRGLVTITVQRTGAGVDYKREVAALTDAIPGARIRDVEGIGTKAFFLDIPDAGTQLHILHGERDHLMISVLGFGGASEISAAVETIAKTALRRLP